MNAQPAGTSPRAGVGAIIRDGEDRVFLHRRRSDGGWAPPTGIVRPGETITDALHREVGRDTGLEVRVLRFLGVYSNPDSQLVEVPGREPVHYVTSVFECERIGGELTGSPDADAWGWFGPMELPEGLLPYGEVWLHDALSWKKGPRIR